MASLSYRNLYTSGLTAAIFWFAHTFGGAWITTSWQKPANDMDESWYTPSEYHIYSLAHIASFFGLTAMLYGCYVLWQCACTYGKGHARKHVQDSIPDYGVVGTLIDLCKLPKHVFITNFRYSSSRPHCMCDRLPPQLSFGSSPSP